MNLALRPETAALLAALDEIYDDDEVPAVLEQLRSLGDPALGPALLEQLRGPLPLNSDHLITLLDQLDPPGAPGALRALLGRGNPVATRAALNRLTPRLTPDDAPLLRALLPELEGSLRIVLLRAIARVDDPALTADALEVLRRLPDAERPAVLDLIASSRLAPLAPLLVEGLGALSGRDLVLRCALLERLRAPQAAPALVERLRSAAGSEIWDLCTALLASTGVDPLADADGSEPVERRRAAYLAAHEAGQLASPPPPSIEAIEPLGPCLLRFDLASGRNQIRFEHDAPSSPDLTWLRWGRSLRIGDRRALALGSTCGTCETVLFHCDFSRDELPAAARQLDDAGLGRGPSIDAGWLAQAAPLLHLMRSGRHLAALIDLPLTPVTPLDPAASWFHRRNERRHEDDHDFSSFPGVAHCQGPLAGTDAEPAYPALLPTQDIDALDPDRVAWFCAAIARGERPWVTALGWIDDRYVSARYPERVIALVALDGHHRAAAYARLGIPARIAVIARLADTWGPPEDRGRHLRQVAGWFCPR